MDTKRDHIIHNIQTLNCIVPCATCTNLPLLLRQMMYGVSYIKLQGRIFSTRHTSRSYTLDT